MPFYLEGKELTRKEIAKKLREENQTVKFASLGKRIRKNHSVGDLIRRRGVLKVIV